MSEDYKHELPKDDKNPVLESAMLTIVKRYADLHEKICKELGTSGGWDQCSREYNGKRYRIIVSEYEHCPVAELTRISSALAGRDPAKLDALVEAVKWVLREPQYGDPPMDQVKAYDALLNALAAFEGRDVPAPPTPTPCTWRNDDEYWQSDCGLAWWLCDGTPAENNMHYCPKCGGDIEIEETTDK